MQKLVKEYLDELNRRQKKNRRVAVAVLLLVVMVTGVVAGGLTQYGVAMTGTIKCGLEEHQHSDACYKEELICGYDEYDGHTHTESCYQTESVLVCGDESEDHIHDESCNEEREELICGQEEQEGHIHGAGCYMTYMDCQMEEHTHTKECYIDTQADVEDANVWNKQYENVDWKDTWGENLVTAAKIQIGYKESSDNYTVAEDGNHKGYNRYGQFAKDVYDVYAGDENIVYADWDAAFTDFCLFYAGLKGTGIFPDEIDAAKWCNEFIKINEQHEQNRKYLTGLAEAEGYIPEAGDIVFFEKETESVDGTIEKETRMGIVSSYIEERENVSKIIVIEGDSEDQVEENEYILEDVNNNIVRYLQMAELEKAYKNIEEEVIEEPETKEPAEEQDQTRQDEETNDGKQTEDTETEEPAEENELTEEEQRQVDEVISMIKGLPDEEEITEKLTKLADAEDEEAYNEYFQDIYTHASEAYEAYMALNNSQKEAVTNAEKLLQMEWLWGADTLEENDGEAATIQDKLQGDEAKVTDIKILDIVDGTEPFDEDNKAGNDNSSTNRRVRTFDTVTYNFLVKMESRNTYIVYKEARVKMEFVIPLTKEQAEFDLGAMAWIDKSEGEPEIKTEKRTITIDGKEIEKECQVLTCYKRLLPSANNKSVVPGEFGENVTINVKSMKNGDSFQPIISAAMEYNTWDGECSEHKEVEKKSVTADKVEVTAAPKYNLQLRGEASYKDTFDFSTGNDKAANKDKGSVTGRILKFGIVLQLYNDNRAKGLKGIELPKEDEDITFNLKLESKYTINQPVFDYSKGQVVSVDEYAPLLWSSGSIKGIFGQENEDGRSIKDSLRCQGLAPYSNKGDNENQCKESGEWTLKQTGNQIEVTVKGYEVDPNKLPLRNADWGDKLYGAEIGIGCFASQEIWILQPFNKIGDSGPNEGPEYDVVKQYGQGAFNTTVKATDLEITTISGTVFADKPGTNDQQTVKDDDGKTYGVELTLPGGLQNRIRYASAIDRNNGVGINDNRNGRDFACVGTDIKIASGFTYHTNGDKDNQLFWGTNLTKFYGNTIEPVTGEDCLEYVTSGGAKIEGLKAYYATKKDGNDWNDDEEMKRTYENDLIFYSDMNKIPKGYLCVGILYCFKGPGALPEEEASSHPEYYAYHKAKVKNDSKLVGNSYSLVSTTRVWTKRMLEKNEKWRELFSDPNKLCWDNLGLTPDHYKSANIEGSTWYIKTVYDEDGNVTAEHNSDWSHWGDTLKIIAYKTGITKHLMQKSNDDKKKDTFNLDADQRVVDFKLEPRTYYDSKEGTGEGGIKDTVTIVDTLPKHLTYREGSAYQGGNYTQIYPDGGTQGQITGGKEFEPKVNKNADGTQTLTWEIEDVEIGTPLPEIYYSADIGSKNPSLDVPTGTTNLLNTVYITAPGDRRDHSVLNGNYSEAGIAVTRGQASAFGKYTKQKVVEKNGKIDYVAYYNNNAQTSTHVVMMDTMPCNGVNGSKFTGSYNVTEWKLDTESCNIEHVLIYYTINPKYQDKTTKEVKEDEIKEWKKAEIDKNTGEINIGEGDSDKIVAWGVIGDLGSHESFNIDMQIQLLPTSSTEKEEDNNFYVNLISSGDITTKVETPTVKRTLEGLTWLDYNRNGIQDQDEVGDRISGVKVELLRLRGENLDPKIEGNYDPVKDSEGEEIFVYTGRQKSLLDNKEIEYEKGRYKFSDLPEGVFAVRFVDGNGEYKITELNATGTDCGEDDTVDSDGIPIGITGGKPQRTVIFGIVMPKAVNMVEGLYESKYHDSGFYPDTSIKLQKQDENGGSLAGAAFTVSDIKNHGPLIAFEKMVSSEGAYKAYGEAEEPVSLGKYYLAASRNDLVIGDGGGYAALQSKESGDGQLFEVFLQPDGSYSFKYGDQHWLDVSGAIYRNEQPVLIYSGDAVTSKENHKWTITHNNDGSCCIHPAGNGAFSLDVPSAGFHVGDCLQLWENNYTDAQKWRLIPAGSINDSPDTSKVVLQVNDDGYLTINNLKPGEYAITEVRSPSGYVLLSHPIKVRLKKDNSVELLEADDMVTVVQGSTGENEVHLKIKNRQLYELPSTGGPGIYWYMFSGMLLMLAAALITYRNKRKEVLES